MGESHPALFKRALFVQSNEIHWIREDLKINENETMNINLELDIDSHYNLELFTDSKRVCIYFLTNQFHQLPVVNL